jgi:cobyrinic acid a,c-diamide synthase
MKAPARLLVAAAASSSGKTTLSLLLMAWARRQGLKVAAFKCGPDFIDAQYGALVCGRPAYNLDAWMGGSKAPLAKSFALGASDADLAVIEGVMGLYDGKRGEAFGRYSSAECAKELKSPVLVVLNARKSGQTLATQLLGLQKADPKVPIAGVILNEASAKTYDLIAPAIKKLCKVPVLGWLPRLKDLELPERHLGLAAAPEQKAWNRKLAAALAQAEQSLDFKAVLGLAKKAPAMKLAQPKAQRPPKNRVRIAMALDEAFHFYYEENLELLRQAGAELIPFSPLKDTALPDNIQGLLLGGGFPELFGEALEKNEFLRREVGARVLEGLCTWAECGGLMYLCGWLTDLKGGRHAMAGALPAEVVMTKRLQNFGYLEAAAEKASAVLPKATRLRGHEFHHSEIHWLEKPMSAWKLIQAGKAPRAEGYVLPKGLATYAHSFLASNPAAAKSFVEACAGSKKGSRG